MPKQKLEIELEIPDGYRWVGYGHALPGTFFLSFGNVKVWEGDEPTQGIYPILSPIERWRPATVEDVIRSLQGEKVEAKFRESEHQEWKMSKLCGFRETPFCPWVSTFSFWQECEVLDTEDSDQ